MTLRKTFLLHFFLAVAVAIRLAIPGLVSAPKEPRLELIRVVVPKNGGKQDEWRIEERHRLQRMETFLQQHRRRWKRPWGEGQGMHIFARCFDSEGESFWISIQKDDDPRARYWLIGRVKAPVFEYEKMETQKSSGEDYRELLDILMVSDR